MTELHEANLATLKHGDACHCPTCGEQGVLDTKTKEGEVVKFETSIWFNTHSQTWECHGCWLK